MFSLNDLNDAIFALKPGERFALEDVPAEIYHKSHGIGSTLMKAATQSMAHYSYLKNFPFQDTRDTLLGSAVHCLVLQPELYEQQFVVPPQNLVPGNNKEWKTWKEAQTLPIIPVPDHIEAAILALNVHDHLTKFFDTPIKERSYWFCDASGLVLKARVDCLLEDCIVDLKTTRAESPHAFAKIVKYEYAIQDAHYRLVTGMQEFVFAGVSKVAPHQCFACKQGTDVRKKSEVLLYQTIDKIFMAQELGQYPYPPVELIETSLSPWE